MARPRIDTNARPFAAGRHPPDALRGARHRGGGGANRPTARGLHPLGGAGRGRRGPARLREPARTEATAIRQELRRIGANLNQALRLAHAGRDPDLAAAVTAVRDIVARRLA